MNKYKTKINREMNKLFKNLTCACRESNWATVNTFGFGFSFGEGGGGGDGVLNRFKSCKVAAKLLVVIIKRSIKS